MIELAERLRKVTKRSLLAYENNVMHTEITVWLGKRSHYISNV